MSGSVGSVSVTVTPDARGWSKKLQSQIRDQKVTVKADADTTEANAELDKTARTRTAKIKTDISQLSQGASKLDQFVGQLGLLPSLAIAAGAALVPLAAAIGGVVAAIGAPLVVAGGGVGLFAVLGGLAVSQAEKQLNAIEALQKSLAGLTKGTAAYAAKAKEIKVAQAALPAGVKQFGSALEGLQSTFAHVDMAILLKPITQGIKLLTVLLPLLSPVLKAVSGAISSLIADLSQGAKSQGFADFVKQFARLVAPNITSFAHIFGNTIKGLAGIIFALDSSLSGGVLHGLEQLSAGFANLGQGAGHSKWLKDFVAYFHQVGPQVATTLTQVARAIGHIVTALAPLGPVVLKGIEGLARVISAMPIPVLTALAGALGALVVVQKFGGLKNVATLLKALGAGATGGGVKGVVGALTGGSVQKVFVVNMPPGFGGPGTGVPGGPGLWSKIKTWAGPVAAAGEGTAQVGLFASAIAAALPIAFTAFMLHENSKPQRYANAKDPNIARGGTAAAHIGTGAVAPFLNPFTTGPQKPFLSAPQINSTSTAFDALKAHAQSASRQIDLIGPHTHQTMAGATADVARFAGVLNSIHDKRIQVIADTASAIRSLEALQRLQIADKSFTVYQRFQIIERAVGPMGGIHTRGGSAPATGSNGGGASAGPTHVHVHLDDGSGRTLHGVISDGADQVYHANRAYEYARAGG